MARGNYTPEFKTKVVLELIQGDKELGEICSEYSLNPNMMRNWKREFLDNAYKVFSESAEKKASRRKEAELKKTNDQMLRTIGKLTLERDFLQQSFRTVGQEPPAMPEFDPK